MMVKYLVWCPDYGSTKDDAREIKALTPYFAAAEWAEREDSDSADYSIVSGNDAIVKVCAVNKPDEVFTYVISGESVPSYTARLVAQEGKI